MIPHNGFDDIIEEITGADVVPLVHLIGGKSNVSEFKIAEKMGITVNKVRNMLYRLDAYSLVNSDRKKDKKKGWYVYFWTLDLIKLRTLAVKIKRNRINVISERMKKEESSEFFNCPDKHIRVNLENAMEYKFKCPECDLPLVREDGDKIRNSLKKQIEKLKQEIELLEKLEIKPVAERKIVRTAKKTMKKKIIKIPASGKIAKKKGINEIKQISKTAKKKPASKKVVDANKKISIREKAINVFRKRKR